MRLYGGIVRRICHEAHVCDKIKREDAKCLGFGYEWKNKTTEGEYLFSFKTKCFRPKSVTKPYCKVPGGYGACNGWGYTITPECDVNQRPSFMPYRHVRTSAKPAKHYAFYGEW